MSREPKPKARRKRRVQVAVISDVHLGTYGCHAEEQANADPAALLEGLLVEFKLR